MCDFQATAFHYAPRTIMTTDENGKQSLSQYEMPEQNKNADQIEQKDHTEPLDLKGSEVLQSINFEGARILYF